MSIGVTLRLSSANSLSATAPLVSLDASSFSAATPLSSRTSSIASPSRLKKPHAIRKSSGDTSSVLARFRITRQYASVRVMMPPRFRIGFRRKPASCRASCSRYVLTFPPVLSFVTGDSIPISAIMLSNSFSSSPRWALALAVRKCLATSIKSAASLRRWSRLPKPELITRSWSLLCLTTLSCTPTTPRRLDTYWPCWIFFASSRCLSLAIRTHSAFRTAFRTPCVNASKSRARERLRKRICTPRPKRSVARVVEKTEALVSTALDGRCWRCAATAERRALSTHTTRCVVTVIRPAVKVVGRLSWVRIETFSRERCSISPGEVTNVPVSDS
ncbi:unnamed protein product [Chondrus crispus]|uniref:Uncharacterized protein n=1 Tax=Chondrus crispus TaxID=2769 RepID=R7Q5A2_CHOCR|nr:unnamed protein product [Chondrus crispus]CDF32640.1 unnamed protein product [Chondrus crispus]|eukprot:XP_005712411.1 unnamed protein product [Chondrus crispus]